MAVQSAMGQKPQETLLIISKVGSTVVHCVIETRCSIVGVCESAASLIRVNDGQSCWHLPILTLPRKKSPKMGITIMLPTHACTASFKPASRSGELCISGSVWQFSIHGSRAGLALPWLHQMPLLVQQSHIALLEKHSNSQTAYSVLY